MIRCLGVLLVGVAFALPGCSTTEGPQVCPVTATCGWKCADGAFCSAKDCRDADACSVECGKGATCDTVDCRGGTCSGKCDEGSSCTFDCAGAEQCDDLECKGDAECLLNCADSASCGFKTCGAPTDCGRGLLACNRACPACGDGVCEPAAGERAATCPEDC
jgi:hypothetical protein